MHLVTVFRLGDNVDVDLRRVCQLVNQSQSLIRAVTGPTQPIGDPDRGNFYSTESLSHSFPDPLLDVTLMAGVTSAEIEDNFFTKTFGTNGLIVTTHHTPELCAAASITFEEYMAQTIATEVLWTAYKNRTGSSSFLDVFHDETRGCIFDLACKKSEKIRKLKRGRLERSCRKNLRDAGVPARLLRSCEKIVKYVQQPPIMRTLMEGLENNPLFSFWFGGVLIGLGTNMLSSLLLGDFNAENDGIVLGLLSISLLVLILVFHFRFRTSRS